MQDNYFNSCTESSKHSLGMQLFEDISCYNFDIRYKAEISNDLSLKLRGRLNFTFRHIELCLIEAFALKNKQN